MRPFEPATRGITIRQPWASLIALGVKRFETRSRPTSYRGWVMIHAAKSRDMKAFDTLLADTLNNPQSVLAPVSALMLCSPMVAPLGVVVAVARITDSIPIVGQGNDYSGRHLFAKPDIGVLKLWGSDGDRGPAVADQLPYGDWTPGRWAHVLDDVIPLDTPVAAKGSQAYPWRADLVTVAAVWEQIGADDE